MHEIAKRVARALGRFALFAGTLYLAIGAYYFARQESYLFYPERLAHDQRLAVDAPHEEVALEVEGGVRLDALLFTAPRAEGATRAPGAAYYLHGNGGSLQNWGVAAGPFTRLGLDVLMIDYRGYGRSGGEIGSERELHADVERGFRWLAERYGEENVVVVGYSLGTALAARVGCGRRVRQVVLHAPFWSIVDAGRRAMPILRLYPDFLFRYPLRTHGDLARCSAPVAIFHGERDELIPIEASERLSKLFKPGDRLIRLPEGGHNNLRKQPGYDAALAEVLAATETR